MYILYVVCTYYVWYVHIIYGMYILYVVCTYYVWYVHIIYGMYILYMVCNMWYVHIIYGMYILYVVCTYYMWYVHIMCGMYILCPLRVLKLSILYLCICSKSFCNISFAIYHPEDGHKSGRNM